MDGEITYEVRPDMTRLNEAYQRMTRRGRRARAAFVLRSAFERQARMHQWRKGRTAALRVLRHRSRPVVRTTTREVGSEV